MYIFFFRFFSITGYYKILNIVPYALCPCFMSLCFMSMLFRYCTYYFLKTITFSTWHLPSYSLPCKYHPLNCIAPVNSLVNNPMRVSCRFLHASISVLRRACLHCIWKAVKAQSTPYKNRVLCMLSCFWAFFTQHFLVGIPSKSSGKL